MTDIEMIEGVGDFSQVHRLQAIVKRLRAPGGCPWDAEQTHESLVSHLIEETYEVIDTIRRSDHKHLEEELGDLLLQVVFHAELQEEQGNSDLECVAKGVSDKLIRRHPHVFEENNELSTDGVLTQWDAIKKQEKGHSEQEPYLHGVGEGLPALLAAYKVQKKVSKVGFDWPDMNGAVEKVREELQEVEDELELQNPEALEEELGDLLFSVVNLTRKLKKDPELLLHEATQKFRDRFNKLEAHLQSDGVTLEHASLDVMESAWQTVKKATH